MIGYATAIAGFAIFAAMALSSYVAATAPRSLVRVRNR